MGAGLWRLPESLARPGVSAYSAFSTPPVASMLGLSGQLSERFHEEIRRRERVDPHLFERAVRVAPDRGLAAKQYEA